MSDLEALYIFLNKPISPQMVQYLVATTQSIIAVQDQIPNINDSGIATPPQSPNDDRKLRLPSLYNFINKLIQYSHVQCTTLMTTLVYLHRLKQVIPPNSIGMHTTHHRIFLGSMLLAAKFTNDSSPMNKHWTSYTDGLLTLREVNALEIEMIQYIGWESLNFTNEHLIHSLQYFLDPIKRSLRQSAEAHLQKQMSQLKHSSSQLNLNTNIQISKSSTISSLPSLVSSSSISTVSSYASMPRKDSVQSIMSMSTSTSPPISPTLETSATTPLQLRPLRLRSTKSADLASTSTTSQNQSIPTTKNSHATQKRKSSITIVPIIPTTQLPNSATTPSLKHSRRNLRLVDATHNHHSHEKTKSSRHLNLLA